jgi:hypothetical protein
MVALSVSATGGNSGGTSLDESWLDNYELDRGDYEVSVDLFGDDLEIRLSSTEYYNSSARDEFDLDGDGIVTWNEVNRINEMLNNDVHVDVTDLPGVYLDGNVVERLIGSWCHYGDVVNDLYDTASTLNERSIRLRCDFQLVVSDFEQLVGSISINTMNDDLNETGYVTANTWHGLDITHVENQRTDGTIVDFNSSSDGDYWWMSHSGLDGNFVVDFEVDVEEYNVCREMEGYDFQEALLVAASHTYQNVTGSLLILQDAEEMQFVSELLGDNGTWVGARQMGNVAGSTTGFVEPDGGWYNLDGTVLNSSLWAYAEPNDWGTNASNEEDYVELWAWGGLNDIDSHAELPVLIEYNMPDGTSVYELVGGWYEVACDEQDNWYDWQDIEYVDYTIVVDRVGDETSVELIARQYLGGHELSHIDSDEDGIISDAEVLVVEQLAASEIDLNDLPNMTLEGEVFDTLVEYGCELIIHQDETTADGTMDWATIQCSFYYQQQVALDDQIDLVIEVEEYDEDDSQGWLSVEVGDEAAERNWILTNVYDENEAASGVFFEMQSDYYWGAQHSGLHGTYVIELQQNENHDHGELEWTDYFIWTNVLDDTVEVEIGSIQDLDLSVLMYADTDNDGNLSDAEIEALENHASQNMNASDLPDLFVNGVLLDNLEEMACEVVTLDGEFDPLNLFQMAELECWFYFVDVFDFDEEIIVTIEVEEYQPEDPKEGIIFAELGEEASENGWAIDNVQDVNAVDSGVYFYMVDESLWEADHQGVHGTYEVKLLNPDLEVEVPEEPEEPAVDLPPECEVAWMLESDMMTMTGASSVVNPSGSLDVTLGAGDYALYVYCYDPDGDMVDVTITLNGLEVGTFSSAEAEGWVEFTVPSDLETALVLEIDWVSTEYSGAVQLNVTVDGGQGGLILGSVVPGFTGVLSVVSMLGALLVVGARRRIE